jgi:membrane protein implicated in regulation of membrane protease activity
VDSETITLIWLVAGILMMGSEMLVPGMVIGFLGLASVIVAGIRSLGLIESLEGSLGLWASISVGLVLGLRNVAQKYFPSEEETVNIDEDSSMYGKEVIVVSACDDTSDYGRIRYQGTSWPAKSIGGTISAGTQAKLVYRDNVAWIIEAIEPARQLEDNHENKVPQTSEVPSHETSS